MASGSGGLGHPVPFAPTYKKPVEYLSDRKLDALYSRVKHGGGGAGAPMATGIRPLGAGSGRGAVHYGDWPGAPGMGECMTAFGHKRTFSTCYVESPPCD